MDKLEKGGALGIGLAQAVALIPGTSRSGITIAAGKAAKLNYEQAAEYSFLIAMPVLLGAIVRSLFEPETTELLNNHAGSVIAGVAMSMLAGLAAIHFMLAFLKKRGLTFFGVYRIILAAGLLLFVM